MSAPPWAAPPVQARAIAWREPLEVFAAFAHEPGALLLESVEGAAPRDGDASGARGAVDGPPALGLVAAGDRHTMGPPPPRVGEARFSYIALEPLRWLTGRGARIVLDGRPVDAISPFHVLDELLAAWRRPARPDVPPFQGGAAGYLGYDLLHHLEAVPAPRDPTRRAPDLAIGLYDLVIAFDHAHRRSWIVCGGLPEVATAPAAARAEQRIVALAARLAAAAGGRAKRTAAAPPTPATTRAPAVYGDFERASYEAGVARVVEHIHAGDIFQANLAQRFRVPRLAGDDDFALYRRLRTASPAPFAAFLRAGRVSIASASPERFVAVRGDSVEARPIKGTRPRGADAATDLALARALLASPKDRAENVMIVDLLRNDLARVCRDGSVQTTQLCALESFAGVHHLVSSVVGRLAPGAGAMDLMRAAFPCGSVTGAPRVRAMEIIHQLEPVRRGPYCGSIGWWGFDGALDCNVAIRTVVLDAHAASIHAGGGIVAASTPAAEYDETLVKAAALVAAARGLPPPAGSDAVATMSAWLAQGRDRRAGFTGATEGAQSEPDEVRASPPEAAPAPIPRRATTAQGAPILLIDNYDSFVDSLARYVGELGWAREVVRNDAITMAQIEALRPAHILLSPGPDGPAEAGICIEIVRRLGGVVPILGICLGHQAIAAALGGRVERGRRPVHGRSSAIHHDGRGAFRGLPDPLRVARYHSLVVLDEGLPAELLVTARTQRGTIMGLRHREQPIVGLQFHPESVQSQCGHRLLANVLGAPGERRPAVARPHATRARP